VSDMTDDEAQTFSKMLAEKPNTTAAKARRFEVRMAQLHAEKDMEISQLRERLQDAELALNVWDKNHDSEYWLRHPTPVSRI
jgi:hypothetical protein